ncbi:MAG TPA: hypothetical protein EYP16_06335 [Candidatus Atribacteria bacterium]|nr:hypothetical protein [Candidatus Atribacteria bacterium]
MKETILKIMYSQSLEEKFRETILNWIKSIERNLSWLISTITTTTLIIARTSYSAMIILGVILWASGIQKYFGRKLIIGGSIIALISEILLK